MRNLARLPGACLLLPGAALAHGVQEAPGWSFDPIVLAPLLACLALYLGGLARLRRRSLTRPAAAYLLGWLLLAGALLSPLHGWGQRCFTAHMLEHEAIMALAAPLLVLGRPFALALWAFPRTARVAIARAVRPARGAWRAATTPAVATVLHAVAIWAWHLPGLFEATLFDASLHRAQHLSFLLSALLFWWAMLRRAAPMVAVADLFITMLHTGLLGALLTFAPRVLYAVQTAGAARFGLMPLEDQQLAGLVMWVPGGVPYVAAALVILGRWLAQARQQRAREDAHAPA